MLGMFQYLAKVVFDMSSIMKPMTELLKSDVAWSWGDAQQHSFNQTRKSPGTSSNSKEEYLVVIDYYSRWIEIKQLTALTLDCVISHLKALFTTHGIPDVVVSDNGRQFVSDEFKRFAESWCFAQHTTNPYSLQENGMAERAVQTSKSLLDLDDPGIGLLNYRATLHCATRVSPAVALMGRQLSTRLPVIKRQLSPRVRPTCEGDLQATLRQTTRDASTAVLAQWRSDAAETRRPETLVYSEHRRSQRPTQPVVSRQHRCWRQLSPQPTTSAGDVAHRPRRRR